MHFPVVKRGVNFYARYVKRGTICQWKVYKRGTFTVDNCIQKDKGLDRGAEPPRTKLCWVTLSGLYSDIPVVIYTVHSPLFFPWDRRDRARLTVYGSHLESNLSRYIWKSRWPPLKVRRARSRWSLGKMGTVNSLVVIFFGTRVGGLPNASHVHSNSSLLSSHHNMKLFEHNCKKN